VQAGLRRLRAEVDSPARLREVGQEAVVLSGLNKQAANTMRNIKNLYDETKYLKSFLEKVEGRVQYDMTVLRVTPSRPPWYKRLVFCCAVVGGAGWAWRTAHPASWGRALTWCVTNSVTATSSVMQFFTDQTCPPAMVTLQ